MLRETSEQKISEKDAIIEVLKANVERLEKRRMEVDSKENFNKQEAFFKAMV